MESLEKFERRKNKKGEKMKYEKFSSSSHLRSPWGIIDPYNLFFYTYSKGNEDLDVITFKHELFGHGTYGIDSSVSLSILSGKFAFSWDEVPGNDSGRLIKSLKLNFSIDIVYLFSWDEVPGNDSGRLIELLIDKFGVDWVKTAKIEKINDDKTIRVTNGKKFLSLRINNENTKINLKIDGGRTERLITKKENGKLNIYGRIKIAKIEKISNGKIIRVYAENDFLSRKLKLELNSEKTKVILTIDDGGTDEFVAKKENGKLNVYSSREYIDSMRYVFEAIAYDRDMQYIKKKKIDPPFSDFYKEQLYFPEIQNISNRVTNIIDIIHKNTGITVLRGEIYEIILHYWRIPVLSRILKKNNRRINPFETIEEIDQIARKLDRRVAEKEIVIQLRKALLKRRFRFLGCVDFPFDLLPFGPEIIMCYELFNEKSEKRRRAIIAHLLNGLTYRASRGIHLPIEALKWENIYALEFEYKHSGRKIKIPLDLFYPPLIEYLGFQDLPPFFSSYLPDDYGFAYHLAKIASDLMNSKKTSNSKKISQNIALEQASERAIDLIYSFILAHEVCDLITIYLLIFSASPFLSTLDKKKIPVELEMNVDLNKRFMYPYKYSMNLTTTEGFRKARDSLDPVMQDKLNKIMGFLFMPEPHIQKINHELQRTISEMRSPRPEDIKRINLDHIQFQIIQPIDLVMIFQIQKCYKEIFGKNSDFVDFILDFPERWKEFNEIAHQAADEYFCPEDIWHEYMFEARKGLQNLETKKVERRIKRTLSERLKKLEKEVDVDILLFNSIIEK